MKRENTKQTPRPNRQRPPQMPPRERERTQQRRTYQEYDRYERGHKAREPSLTRKANYSSEDDRYGGTRKDYPVRRPQRPESFARGRESERPIRPAPPRRMMEVPLEQPRHSMKKRIFMAGYNLIFYLITISIVATGIMVFFSGKNDASIMGYRFYRVLTASMKPQPDSPPGGFDKGAVAIVKLMNGKDTKEGDIVTYALGDGGFFLTHRLVERVGEMEGREGSYVLTKGDANNTNDPPVDERQIVGKVVYAIPKIGNLVQFVQEQFWACLVCVLSLFGFFLVLKAYLTSDSAGKGSSGNVQPRYY